MPKFNLYAGLTGGFNSVELVEENVECKNLREAEMFAYDYALEKFESMAGMHGLSSYTDIEESLYEDCGDEFNFDDIVMEEYLGYVENWIIYYAKEVIDGKEKN